MAEQNANAFPMDFYVDDPAPRPWKFQPTGYLVVILADTEEGNGQRVRSSLPGSTLAMQRSTQGSRSSITTTSTWVAETSRTASPVR
jgi:hypothetical protein